MIFGLGCGGSKDSPPPTQEQGGLGLDALNRNLKFDIPEVMEFDQGKSSQFPFQVVVPEGYSWTLQAENLPPGAVVENQVLSWAPSCELSVEDGYFKDGYHIFYARFTLTINGAEDNYLQESVALIVRQFRQAGKICGT
jgi:hypothetical protein